MQRRRLFFQLGFFALFLLAPALNLLRFDLNDTQLWLLGQRWSLGIDDFRAGRISADEAAVGIFLRGFLPAIALVAAFLAVAWRHGRLYCGWLCPHFTLVETLNTVLHRACGRFSLWDRHRTPRAGVSPSPRWWPVFGLLCAGFGFLWAITLLSYLLPPATVWGGLFSGTLTANQARFLGIATLVFTAEFALARHLFCRFGCAVGLFQSLVWMSNPRARVVRFNADVDAAPASALRSAMALSRERARPAHCRSCDPPRGSACDHACPMQLQPRNVKRRKFSCVQCGLCLDACAQSQDAQRREPLLTWTVGVDELRASLRAHRGRGLDSTLDRSE